MSFLIKNKTLYLLFKVIVFSLNIFKISYYGCVKRQKATVLKRITQNKLKEKANNKEG